MKGVSDNIGCAFFDCLQTLAQSDKTPPMSLQPNFGSLAGDIVQTLQARKLKLAVAESCTGGLVSAAITDIAGASDVFEYGFITYANRAKEDLIGVPGDLLAAQGAVSAEVAVAMADGARAAANANVAVAITGIAGPSGGSADKPVGLVFIATAGPQGDTVSTRHVFENNGRAEIRQQAARAALTQVLTKLRNC